MATITLYPNGAGFQTNLTPNGAASNWDCVDETSTDEDTTYVSVSNASRNDLYIIQSNSIGASDTINSVTVYIRARVLSVSKATGRAQAQIRENSVTTVDVQQTLTTSYVNYSKTWSSRPSDSQPWTKSDIDSLQIGVTLTASSTTSRCTQVYVVIDYNTSSKPTTPPTILIWEMDN